jgi:hypothetical protein
MISNFRSSEDETMVKYLKRRQWKRVGAKNKKKMVLSQIQSEFRSSEFKKTFFA